MGIGLLFAGLVTLCGVAVNRPLRAHWSLAPFSGLATLAVAATWCAALGVPGWAVSGGLVVVALLGATLLFQAQRRQKLGDGVTALTLGAALLIPWLLLGLAMAGVDAPVSTHDGAFHVELIDKLRRGLPIQGWYPMGFHASVAAVLRLVPWVDTARGTTDAAQALSFMAPLGIFAFGLALGLRPRLASLAALILALTYIYPYDNQMWGGWPLSTSLLLLLGLWSVGARWIDAPRVELAVLAGLVAGAIVVTHGTEVYSAVIGLSVIGLVRWRRIRLDQLARHAPLAAAGAVLCVLPYLSTLLGWAAGGGASAVGAATLDDAGAQQLAAVGGGDWLEFVLGITGAAGLIDLPLRAALLCIGARQKQLRVALVGWACFSGLLFAVSFLDIAPVRRLYVVTYPWLVHHRPPQLVVLFASLLVGGGLLLVLGEARARLRMRPVASRRVALVGGALLLFFAEGSAVTIFKTVQAVVADQYVYTSDDQAAMGWLRTHAASGEVVINDQASDAGIWAPYKAGLAVLLPRSAPASDTRTAVLSSVTDLSASPTVLETACSLRADYVYVGSRDVPDDPLALPARAALEHADGLQEVFASGGAAIFKVDLPCGALS